MVRRASIPVVVCIAPSLLQCKVHSIAAQQEVAKALQPRPAPLNDAQFDRFTRPLVPNLVEWRIENQARLFGSDQCDNVLTLAMLPLIGPSGRTSIVLGSWEQPGVSPLAPVEPWNQGG